MSAAALPRRAVLGRLTLAAGAALALPPVPVATDAELLALGDEMDAAQHAMLVLEVDYNAGASDTIGAAYDAQFERFSEIAQRICQAKAMSFAGLAVKARAIAHLAADEFNEREIGFDTATTDMQLVWSILADLAPRQAEASRRDA